MFPKIRPQSPTAIAKLIRGSIAIAIVLFCLIGTTHAAIAVEHFPNLKIHTISSDLSSTGSLDSAALQQAAEQGFKSVLNLRSPQEKGFLSDEADQVTALGMAYANVPVNPTQLNDAVVAQVLEQFDTLPKPILVHCSTGTRATGMALLPQSIEQHTSPEQFFQQVKDMGLDMGDRPVLQQFFADYLTQH